MQSKLVNFQNTDLGDPFWKFNLEEVSSEQKLARAARPPKIAYGIFGQP